MFYYIFAEMLSIGENCLHLLLEHVLFCEYVRVRTCSSKPQAGQAGSSTGVSMTPQPDRDDKTLGISRRALLAAAAPARAAHSAGFRASDPGRRGQTSVPPNFPAGIALYQQTSRTGPSRPTSRTSGPARRVRRRRRDACELGLPERVPAAREGLLAQLVPAGPAPGASARRIVLVNHQNR